ncbi:synaptogyrin-1-like, partial [Discoglossus pictus]
MAVFGCIINEGHYNRPNESELHCIFNMNPTACTYGVTVGLLSFFTCLLYLALDAHFLMISSIKDRKRIVQSDICVSANQWELSSSEDNLLKTGDDAAMVAISFSFFSILSWAGQAWLAFYRYQRGIEAADVLSEFLVRTQDLRPPYTAYTNNENFEPATTYEKPTTDPYRAAPRGYQ